MLFLSLTISFSLSLSYYLFHLLTISFSLSLTYYLFPLLTISFSFSLTYYLFHLLTISYSLYLSLILSLTYCFSTSLYLYLLTLSLSHLLSLSLYLSLIVSLHLSSSIKVWFPQPMFFLCFKLQLINCLAFIIFQMFLPLYQIILDSNIFIRAYLSYLVFLCCWIRRSFYRVSYRPACF